MNKLALIPLAIALTLFASCGKQQTEAEKNAEVERQVQQRLEIEHQAQAKQQLAAREADLAAREKALADQQDSAMAETPVPQTQTPPPRSEPVPEEKLESSRDVSTDESASYDAFYAKLDPYGDWRETADYGYVFQPRAAEGSRKWRPYTNGRWVYTDAGWTWVSEEPFGWATYHYGRWTRLRHIGWVWVPGDEWAPAWVSWRKSNDYVGWAPLPPEANFDRRTGIHHWADSYYDLGPEEYSFVPTNEFGSQRIEQTVVPQERNVTIVSQTINVTNITYNNTMIVNQGPNYEDLSHRSRQPIARLRLERGGRFENGDSRAIVRGEVISMAAPFIAPAQRRGRPARVKETISDTVVDHGATEVAERSAAQEARAKMRAESTPPAGLPPKKFVKPVVAATPVPPQPRTSAIQTPTGTVESTPMQNFPGGHGKEINQQRLRKDAQRKAGEERKTKQMVKPTRTPAASVPASPAATARSVAAPVASIPAKAAPLPIATAPRKDGRDVGKSPVPNASVPRQAPTITPSTSPLPVRVKAVPSPVATVAPSATIPTDNRVRSGPNPPLQKRVFASPAPPAKHPAPPVTPPVTKPATTSSPAERIKAAPKSQPSATASPGEGGKGPTEKE